MSVTADQFIIGNYEIEEGATDDELVMLGENPGVSVIGIHSPLSASTIEALERCVFSKRPDMMLRLFDHFPHRCDLGFLEQLPSIKKLSLNVINQPKNIETVSCLRELDSLSVEIYELKSFDWLDHVVPTLKQLSLYQTKSKKIGIENIARFTGLQELLLEGHDKGIESIAGLKELEKITLQAISTQDVDYLKNLEQLWSVDIKLGTIRDFSALASLSHLKYLEFWRVRGLSDLSFISGLTSLQHLFIQSLRYFELFPSLADLTKLRRIRLEDLKGLKDLDALRYAPALEEFVFAMTQNLQPDNFRPVLENGNLKSIQCRFGNKKKNEEFRELALSFGKEQFEYRDFIYN